MTPHQNDESKFRWKVAVFSGITFLLAGITPLIIDPKLVHHVRYGARNYPESCFYGLAIFSFLVFIFTFLLFSKVNYKKRVWLATTPIWAFSLPMFWMLRPELPHMGFLNPLLISSFLFTITVGVRYQQIKVNNLDSPDILPQAKIERVKEEIAFWRTGFLALLGGYLALVITWFNSIRLYNIDVTPDEGEEFLLNTNGIILVCIQSAWFFFCVLPELINKTREALKLLEKIPNSKNKTEEL